VTRVNLANVLDEGLRIGEKWRRMNSKIKISQTRRCFACIENKRGAQLDQSQSIPGRPLLAPLYMARSQGSGRVQYNYNVRIRYHLVFFLKVKQWERVPLQFFIDWGNLQSVHIYRVHKKCKNKKKFMLQNVANLQIDHGISSSF
jgi:hypothetical protein